MRELSKRPPTSRVALRILNRSKPITVALLKKYIPNTANDAGKLWRGMRVDYSTALPTSFLTRQVRHIDFSKCIGVVYVEYDSPAWRAGIRRGEFIERVDGTAVSKPDDFDKLVQETDGPVDIVMAGIRKEVRRVEAPAVRADVLPAGGEGR